MIEITKLEEEIAYTPLTGVCVPRLRLFTSRGWVYRVGPLADIADLQDEAKP